jgi:hypothetical protein
MNGINEVRAKVAAFFRCELQKESEALRFLKLSQLETGWEGRVEVTEENTYLKKLGYPTIFDKNVYIVTLDNNLNVTSYEETEE